MRRSSLTFAPFGIWLAACSTPAPDPGHQTSAPPLAAPLLAPPPTEAQLTSALEAGNAAGLDLIGRTAARTGAKRPAQRPAPKPEAVAAIDEALPAVSAAANTSSLVAAPASMPMAALPAPRSDEPLPVSNRGPMIIIRGGAGGPLDDCKIHGPGYIGPGIAINNRMPVMGGNPGGGILVNERAPRFGGTSRIPRGGMR